MKTQVSCGCYKSRPQADLLNLLARGLKTSRGVEQIMWKRLFDFFHGRITLRSGKCV